MNRQDPQPLVEDRILDAQALLDSGRWSAAYYLAGYAVECALKACVAKQTREYDFPDIKRARGSHVHDFSTLIAAALLKDELEGITEGPAPSATGANWLTAKDWRPDSRYERTSEARARILFEAITDPARGVLPWIKKSVVTEETNAGLELIERLNESLPIQAAFWVKDAYDGQWFLYLASGLVTDGTIREGYGEVIKAYNQKPNVYLDLMRVKLISLDNPLAKEALGIYERYPEYAPTFLGARSFGGMSMDEGYLYPQSIMPPASSPTS